MTISVVIPNRNYGAYLADAVRSAAAQTVPPNEIIVVDGESQDQSKASAAATGARLRWLSCPPMGRAHARNHGIMATDADLIVPLDADDWIEPTYIERCCEAMVEGVGIVATDLQWPTGRVQKSAPPFTVETFLTGNRLFSCSMFRRACWQQVGGYDEEDRLYEDWLFFAMIVSHGWRIACVNEPLFHYRPHPGSNSARLLPGDDADYRRRTIHKLNEYHQLCLSQ